MPAPTWTASTSTTAASGCWDPARGGSGSTSVACLRWSSRIGGRPGSLRTSPTAPREWTPLRTRLPSPDGAYIQALRRARAVDRIEFGKFYEKTKSPAARGKTAGRPNLVLPASPLFIQDGNGVPVRDARFMVEVADREEKGSDVNLATLLLIDAFSGAMDAAVVVSNDSDLALPVREVRSRLPVGTIVGRWPQRRRQPATRGGAGVPSLVPPAATGPLPPEPAS